MFVSNYNAGQYSLEGDLFARTLVVLAFLHLTFFHKDSEKYKPVYRILTVLISLFLCIVFWSPMFQEDHHFLIDKVILSGGFFMMGIRSVFPVVFPKK